MSNVERYKILEKLHYINKYKFDIRLLLQTSTYNNYIYNYKNNTYPCLIGIGVCLMIYNFAFLTSIDYYAYNFYSTGFYDYSFLNINIFVGSRFIFNLKNNFFLTNKLITEVFFGLERMKVYDAYNIANDEHIINPCMLVLLLFDYKEKQIGLGLKIKQCKTLHNMQFSSLSPSIIFRL